MCSLLHWSLVVVRCNRRPLNAADEPCWVLRRRRDDDDAVRRLRDHVHANADVDDVAADPGPVHGRRPPAHSQVPVHRHRVRAAVVAGRRGRQRGHLRAGPGLQDQRRSRRPARADRVRAAAAGVHRRRTARRRHRPARAVVLLLCARQSALSPTEDIGLVPS